MPVLITLFSFVLSFLLPSEKEWVLLKEHDRFTVYYRQMKESKLQELKIVALTTAAVPEVIAALESVDKHKEWVYATSESYILKRRSNNEFDYYVSVDMPFPVKDRDLVIRYRRERGDAVNEYYTYSEAVPGVKSEREGFVRIKKFDSTYHIFSSDNKTKIEYIVSADPGGSLPVWLVNLLKAHGPTRTINTLLNHLEDGRYKQVKVEGL